MTKLQEIKSIIDELRSDNSSNFKLQILEKHKDNEDWKKYLYYTYNPNFNYYINKIPKVYYQGSKTCFDVVINTLDKFRNQELRGNKGIEVLTLMLELCDENEAEVIELLIGRDIKCGINVTSINKVYKDLIPETPYQRCSKLDEKTINNITFPAILQKKADGIFCYIKKENDNVLLITRNGTSFTCNKIENELSNIKEEFVLIGELLVKSESSVELDRKTGNGLINSYIKRFETLNNLESKSITDKVLKEISIKKDEFNYIEENLIYEAWDIISINDYYNNKSFYNYNSRLETLKTTIKDLNSIKMIETFIVNDIDEAKRISKEYINNGYEGSILKNKNVIWENKTSKYMLKIKQILDIDLLCVDVEEGTGKNTGKVGALVLESKCKKLKVKVGTGLSDNDREKPFDYYKGKVIEVQYNEVIKAKYKDTYSLFLPVFIEVREKSRYDELVL